MNLSRGKKALVSTIVSFILEIVNIVSALVVPRVILITFGSDANGLINSITQFLGYISFLQMGVGGVIKAALYKPLAYGDIKQTSRVIKATENFFYKVGMMSVVYAGVLAIGYPLFSDSSFDYIYTASMVVIISVGTIAQYMWGFTYRNLLIADQSGYISSLITILATIINIVVTVLMVYMGASLHATKLISSTVFVVQPLLLRYVCRVYYKIDRNVEPDNDAIKQRMNGFVHSFADFVHRKTDVFILTVCASLKDVSVYSVYSVITNGLNALIAMVTGPFMAAMGNMLVRKEENVVKDTMRIYFFLIHFISTLVFSVAIVTILSFVQIYTNGVQDADYHQERFSILLILAEMIACMKQPYGSLTGAAGHYRQTRLGPVLEAFTNLLVSIILVGRYGIVGVAIGTLTGMIVGTVYSIWYVKHNIIYLSYRVSVKRYAVSALSVLVTVLLGNQVHLPVVTIWEWILKAVLTTLMAVGIITGIHFVFYKEDMKKTICKLMATVGKK